MSAKNNIFIVSHYKGGTGKSSVAMNFARAIELLKYSVVLVDIDRDSTTASTWRTSWANLKKLEEVENPPDAPLPPVMAMSGDVGPQIEKLAQQYDYVVIDAGAGTPVENRSAIRVVDMIIVPVSPSGFDISPTLKYMDQIRGIQMANNGRPKARVLLNKIMANKNSSEELVTMFNDPSMPIPKFATLIPNREAMTNLLTSGVSVFDYPRAKDLRQYFTELAKEAIEVIKN